MKTEEKQNFKSELLTDTEFAQLMMVEFSNQSKKRLLWSRSTINLQALLWAAGLGVFLIYQPDQTVPLDTEFSLDTFISETEFNRPNFRGKNENSADNQKPMLSADFSIQKRHSDKENDDDEDISPDIVQLMISSIGIRSVRVDVHLDGKLKVVRAFDSLLDPLEQKQDALFRERKWGFALSPNTPTLICLKPSKAPASPPVLSLSEMRQRAETFPDRCFFRD